MKMAQPARLLASTSTAPNQVAYLAPVLINKPLEYGYGMARKGEQSLISAAQETVSQAVVLRKETRARYDGSKNPC